MTAAPAPPRIGWGRGSAGVIGGLFASLVVCVLLAKVVRPLDEALAVVGSALLVLPLYVALMLRVFVAERAGRCWALLTATIGVGVAAIVLLP